MVVLHICSLTFGLDFYFSDDFAYDWYNDGHCMRKTSKYFEDYDIFF